MPPGFGDGAARRLQNVSVSAASLRRRVSALRGAAALQAYDIDDELTAAAAEARRLTTELQPMVEVAADFRRKWDREKEQLLTARQAQIEFHLRKESAGAYQQAETAAAEDVKKVIQMEAVKGQERWQQLGTSYSNIFKGTVEAWKRGGAEHVDQHHIQQILASAFDRLCNWVVKEEGNIIASWNDTLKFALKKAHQIDEDVMGSTEDILNTRRDMLDNLLHKQKRDLALYRASLTQKLGQLSDIPIAAHDTQNVLGDAAKVRAARSEQAVALGRAAQKRLDDARHEAAQASEAYVGAALARLDSYAHNEQAHLNHFNTAFAKIRTDTEHRLDMELQHVTGMRAADSASDARVRPQGRAADMAEGVARRQSVRQSLKPNGAGRMSLANPAARMSITGPKGTSRMSVASPLGNGGGRQVASPSDSNKRAGVTQDGPGSPTSPESPQSPKQAATALKAQELRTRIEVVETALREGNWGTMDWRNSHRAVTEEWQKTLSSIEEALQAQGRVLANESVLCQDDEAMKQVDTNISNQTSSFTSEVQEEYVKIRNAKVGLSQNRKQYIKEAMTRLATSTPEIEAAAVAAVSRLAKETETALEIGHAVRRGPEEERDGRMLPVAVIAGSWRRAVLASFPILKRIWEDANVDEKEQRLFMRKLGAILARGGIPNAGP